MISSASALAFTHRTNQEFRFERFMKDGKHMWQAACTFEVRIQLDPRMDFQELMNIEYRQFISGGVWVRQGNRLWTADDNPNANDKFLIPPYAGQTKVSGIPMRAVRGKGLSLMYWKEDGKDDGTNPVVRYGHRNANPNNHGNEVDRWSPGHLDGFAYTLKDKPAIWGEWPIPAEKIEVWIELYFKGFVVQVERNEHGDSLPIKILKEKEWKYFWPEKVLNRWIDASPI